MKIILPKYATNYNLVPFSTEEEANFHNVTFQYTKQDVGQDNYVIYWGNKAYDVEYGSRYGVMETGFFNEAAFIDTVGNYQHSSLNSKEGYVAVEEFDLNNRPSAREIIFNLPSHKQSKYNAEHGTDENYEFEVVLALQNPSDRSILSVSSTKKYFEFVEQCCKYYGKSLFVKMHPWNTGDKYDVLAKLVDKYGCNYGKSPMSIINRADFVISYNSTIAIDCLLRDVPYVQYAMGTFYNAYGIIFSRYTFPHKITRIENASKLCDFLIHRYCFHKKMDPIQFKNMLIHYSTSNKMFPMIDEFSYANNVISNK